jgi:hypothetical protein
MLAGHGPTDQLFQVDLGIIEIDRFRFHVTALPRSRGGTHRQPPSFL